MIKTFQQRQKKADVTNTSCNEVVFLIVFIVWLNFFLELNQVFLISKDV